jgi:hypothetical protein
LLVTIFTAVGGLIAYINSEERRWDGEISALKVAVTENRRLMEQEQSAIDAKVIENKAGIVNLDHWFETFVTDNNTRWADANRYNVEVRATAREEERDMKDVLRQIDDRMNTIFARNGVSGAQ